MNSSVLKRYMQAVITVWIAFFEGYFNIDSIASENNNPGNLRTWGHRPTRKGYAYFNTPAEGWLALFEQVGININRNLTLREFFAGKPGVYAGYAPSEDNNDPETYARFIADKTGLPLDVPLLDFLQEI